MNELQKTYIRSQILTMPIKANRELYRTGRMFARRPEYENMARHIDDFLEGKNINRFILLPGMQGAGKTTLLFQAYDYLLKEKNISPKNILCFSCDMMRKLGKADIFETVESYSRNYHNSIIETLPEPVFILVDDAQKDNDWDLNGKLIFDASRNVFMIFTGPSHMKHSYGADAARRLLSLLVNSLTYSQHLKLIYGGFKNDFSDSIVKMIFEGDVEGSGEIEPRMVNIYSAFDAFAMSEWRYFLKYGGFPFSIHQNTGEITGKIDDVIDKGVTSNISDDDARYLAFQILNFIAFQNPGPVSKDSLANTFDADKTLVSEVLDALEKARLIFHIEPFATSRKTAAKPHKYFPATSSLKHNLALSAGMLGDEAKLLETYVASSFLNLDEAKITSYKTYYDGSDKNVDFIVQRGNDAPVPIEVSCTDKDKSQIRRAIGRYHSSHGVIISNTTSGIVKKDDIIYMPPEIFAFM